MLKALSKNISGGQLALHRASRGATLLEVLIAVVILAIGLLGFAALQSTSLQSGHSSYQRSQATWLAYDILDRMRANAENIAAYEFDWPATAPVCNPSLTATGTRAARDRAEWLNAIACHLRPAGNGRVSVDNRTVVVSVRWTDARGNITDGDGLTDPNFQPDTTVFDLRTEF